MKKVWIGISLIVILVAVSCKVNKLLSSPKAEESSKIVIVGEDIYVIRLERLAKLTGDSTLTSDYSKAVTYLHSINDRIDIKNGSRKMLQRGIRNILSSINLENQSGTMMKFDIWVDRSGFLVASKYDNASTTVLSKSQKSTVTSQSLTYQMSEDLNAPALQMSEIKISLSNINAFGG
jgi:hypothetical protein